MKMRDIITEQEELAEEEMINEVLPLAIGLGGRALLSGAGRQLIKKYGKKGLSFLQNFMKGAKNPKARAVAGADSTAGMTPTTFVKAGTGTMARVGNNAGRFVGRNKGTLATTAATTGLAAGIDTNPQKAGTTPTPMDAGEFAGTTTPTKLVAKPDKEATLDNTPKPASIVARDKYAGRDTNRGLDVGRGRDMTRADAVAQAGAKFKPSTPAVAKTSKYPKGDIRNLGKYIKPANVTNQGGKKMSGDVEPQKKGADLRNLLKLAGVKQPRSDDDRK